MSTEPQGSPAPETPPTPDAAQPTATSSIINELSNLGKKMGTTVQSALNSPEFKDFEREVRDGFNTAVNEMNDAISKARSTDVAKDVSGQAGKVVDNMRSSKLTQDMRDGFLKGLKALNRELDNAIERFDTKAEAPAPPETPSDPSI